MLERSEQTARWIELYKEKVEQDQIRQAEAAKADKAAKAEKAAKKSVLSQVDSKLSSRGRVNEGRPESGVRQAARELNITQSTASRAVQIAELPDTVKTVAKQTGTDNNQNVLLQAAKINTTAGAPAATAFIQQASTKQQPAPATPDLSDEYAAADFLLTDRHQKPYTAS